MLGPDQVPAVSAIEVILQPLAKLMVDHGVLHGQVAELLKTALVLEAASRKSSGGRDVADTRVSLLTGVHRKDIRRIRGEVHTAPAKGSASVISSVIARWISDPRYLNIDQTPRSLGRSPKVCPPGEPDFSSLISEVNKDLSARTVLDEMLRLGVVQLIDNSRVVLVDQAFVPKGSPKEQFHFLASTVGDHFRTAVHNLDPSGISNPMLDQSAFSENLSLQQAQLLQSHARKLWAGALQKFLQSATIAEERSKGGLENTHRVQFGVYFYEDGPKPIALKPARKRRRST